MARDSKKDNGDVVGIKFVEEIGIKSKKFLRQLEDKYIFIAKKNFLNLIDFVYDFKLCFCQTFKKSFKFLLLLKKEPEDF